MEIPYRRPGRSRALDLVYGDIERGIVFETDDKKADHLAWQRPTWAVYEARAESALAAGAAAHLPVNLLDVDPYGDPWPVLAAFFESEREFPQRLGVAVNDGLKQKLNIATWDVETMQETLVVFGNKGVAARYLESCAGTWRGSWRRVAMPSPSGQRITAARRSR